jgi:hypothetical protein
MNSRVGALKTFCGNTYMRLSRIRAPANASSYVPRAESAASLYSIEIAK